MKIKTLVIYAQKEKANSMLLTACDKFWLYFCLKTTLLLNISCKQEILNMLYHLGVEMFESSDLFCSKVSSLHSVGCNLILLIENKHLDAMSYCSNQVNDNKKASGTIRRHISLEKICILHWYWPSTYCTCNTTALCLSSSCPMLGSKRIRLSLQ